MKKDPYLRIFHNSNFICSSTRIVSPGGLAFLRVPQLKYKPLIRCAGFRIFSFPPDLAGPATGN